MQEPNMNNMNLIYMNNMINMNNMIMNNISMTNNINMSNNINMNNNMNMNNIFMIDNMSMNNMNKINNNNSQENNIKEKDSNDTILPIILFHLQNVVNKKDKKKKNSDKNKKLKENNDKIEKLKEELSTKYYKIENDKNKEIENFFKSPKSKVNLKGGSILSNNKIYTSPKDNIIKIYDINNSKEIYTINCKKEETIYSAIELDNKDLIINAKEKGVYKLLVYRLNNKNYNLIQTIEELTGKLRRDVKGYYHSKPLYKKHEIKFDLIKIKKLANNRFMSVSNYEIKLYSLNKTNSYEVILLYNDTSLQYIYEIDDENYLIIDSIQKYYQCFYNIQANYPDHVDIKRMDIKKIKLNKINETEKEKILDDNKQYLKFTNLISSIKLIASEENSAKIEETAFFSNCIILKKKYLLIQSCCTFYILNLANLEHLVKYKIQVLGEKKMLSFDNMSIEKWKCTDDNEFLLKLRGNITLFKLEEKNENKIMLNVIAFSYFPKLDDLYRINEENRFLVFGGDGIEVY